MKTKTDKKWITYSDIHMLVEGRYYKGYPGTWEQPSEPEEFEIFRVFVGETDITDLLSYEQMQEIEEKALER